MTGQWVHCDLDEPAHWLLQDCHQVLSYQEMVNSYGLDVDVEHSKWLLNVLTKTTKAPLLVEVTQSFDTFFDAQMDGLSLFNLLLNLNKIDHHCFEPTQALINLINEFKLTNYDCTNVHVATSRLKTVVCLLLTSSIHPNLVKYFHT